MSAATASFAYAIAANGTATRLPVTVGSEAADGVLLWRHVDGNDDACRTWLQSRPDIPAAALQALQAEDTRPRTTKFGEGAFVALRGVNQNPDADPRDLVSIHLWVTAHEIVSMSFRPLLAIGDMEVSLKAGAVADSGDFIVELAKVLTSRLEDVIEALSIDLEALEDDLISGKGGAFRERIGRVRRVAIELRRFISPQRDALALLASGSYAFFDGGDRQFLAEAANSVTRIVEEIDSVRDQAEVLADQLSDIRAEAVGNRTLLLSIVSAVFLPLSYIAGLVGMNVAGIPFAAAPWAFWAIVAVNVAIAAGVLLLLAVKGWFR